MSDKPLSTERVRDLYTCATAWHTDNPRTAPMRASNRAEFDRWLADHDAEVRADERAKIASSIRGVADDPLIRDGISEFTEGLRDGLAEAAEIAERAS